MTGDALARRRALIKGLGKGSAALAAAAPLASHATRDYVLNNPALGGNAYCSVSGFQSAAISFAPGQTTKTCAASPPSAFYTPTSANYVNATTGSSRRRRGIQTLLAAPPFSVSATNAQADSLIAGNWVPIVGRVYKQTASTTDGGTILELKEVTPFPSASDLTISGVMAFKVLMGSGTVNKTVLQTLYEYATDNNAYFAAVFLSCVAEDGAVDASSGYTTGSIPFDAKYVGDQYKNNQAGSIGFFKKICGA